MKVMLLISSCFALTSVDASVQEQWISFKKENRKKYNTTEEQFRLSIFTENLKKIEEHNANYTAGKVTYTLKMNQFGDLRPEEFLVNDFKKDFPNNKSSLAGLFTKNEHLPDSIDWRDKGAVTQVKNQAHCNGCWSFATTGAMEGQLFQKTGKLVSLSEQQLIDCSRAYGNLGCNGGFMVYAFNYIKEAGGMMREDSYPFKGADSNSCFFKPESTVKGTMVKSYVELPGGDEYALKKAVATVGPVSVAVAANEKFAFYDRGILTSSGCGQKLSHAVLVVGYGTEFNRDYWIIKNSWSTKWGEEGYGKIERNRGNVCGVASLPSYPILEDKKNDITTVQPTEQITMPSKAWKAVLSSGNLIVANLLLIYFLNKSEKKITL